MKHTVKCPSCGSFDIESIYCIKDVPVHSVRLLKTFDAAVGELRGDIELGFCHQCGFITNIKYDPAKNDYFIEYESTQSCSPTFNSFADTLAASLVKRYDLKNKKIIEIGCGQGEFLRSLCKIGNNNGIGFDPAYSFSNADISQNEKISYVKDYYSEKYSKYQADFVCCKMTLEHIPDVNNFVSMVYRTVKNNPNVVVYFQIPDMERILEEKAFWDIYYEHCSYFSAASLSALFKGCGFDVLNLDRGYQNQYLMIEARPASDCEQNKTPSPAEIMKLSEKVKLFKENINSKISFWKELIRKKNLEGKKIVLWGAGSKGVAFLTTLQIQSEIEFAVDINPRKQGTFMAGTGQRIVLPEFLQTYMPDLVIVMNPVYENDVKEDLIKMGLNAQVMSLC